MQPDSRLTNGTSENLHHRGRDAYAGLGDAPVEEGEKTQPPGLDLRFWSLHRRLGSHTVEILRNILVKEGLT